jgi:hypothetical protein
MNWSPQVKLARMVPWDDVTWGVEVEFADGFRVTYPVGSRNAASHDLHKLKTDPQFAVLVRWGKQ